MDRVRWGIIGCGDVTEVKSGPALQKCDGSELVAVMRRDIGKAQDYASRHNVDTAYGTTSELINDPRINAVYVATPPGSHAEIAHQICAAGKAAYIEKPISTTVAAGQAVINAFSDAKTPLFVAYYRRALPRFEKIAELLLSGAIGKLTSVNISYASPKALQVDTENLPWRFDKDIAGGGLFVDLASHTLDILDYLLGPIEFKSSVIQRKASDAYDVEDGVSMLFNIAGVMGAGQWNFASYDYHDRVELAGSKGKLSFSTFGNTPIELVKKTGVKVIESDNPEHIQQPLIQSIVNELLGKGLCPSTGETALRTTKVIEQALST